MDSICVKSSETRQNGLESFITSAVGNCRCHIQHSFLGELACLKRRRLVNIRRNTYGILPKKPNPQVAECVQVALFQWDMGLVTGTMYLNCFGFDTFRGPI